MNEYPDEVSPSLMGRVQEEASTNQDISCSRIRPKSSELVGEGNGRCVFEKDGKVFKIAKNKDGLAQNKNAKNVKKYVNYHTDGVAIPIVATEEIVVQKKAEPFEKVMEENPDKSKPELEEEIFEQVEKVEKEGVICSDRKYENYGWIEGKGGVLTDLGQCRTTGYNEERAKDTQPENGGLRTGINTLTGEPR